MGRAARHVDGHVIMYADVITDSMRQAMEETKRRRAIQEEHNRSHGIEPQGIRKAIRDITDRIKAVAEERAGYDATQGPVSYDIPREELVRLIKDLEQQMRSAAKDLEFEKAALIRDRVVELRKLQATDPVEAYPGNLRARILDESPAKARQAASGTGNGAASVRYKIRAKKPQK